MRLLHGRPGSAALLSCLAVATVLLTPAVPAAADPPPPSVHLTNSDNGRTLDLPAGTEVEVDLTPARDGDIWHLNTVGTALDAHTLDETSTGSTLTARVNAGTTLRAVTDAACTHAASPCPYTAEQWSVTVTVPAGPVPDNPSPAACSTTPATPTAGVRIITTADAGRGVTVHQGDRLLVDLACSGTSNGNDPWTVPTATGPLFRDYVRATSDLHGLQAGFATEAPGRTNLDWSTDVRCVPSQGKIVCFGRPSALFRVIVTVVPPGTPIDPRDDQCVQDLSPVDPYPLADTTATLRGHADPGATVSVWFRKAGESSYTLRRTVLADSSGRYTTSFVANAAYDVYATAGTACKTYTAHIDIRPRIAGPAVVRRGSTVSLTVHGLPGSAITIAFRRQGETSFVVRRRAHLDANGRYATTYRADADYRYMVRDETHYLTGNTGLTQTR